MEAGKKIEKKRCVEGLPCLNRRSNRQGKEAILIEICQSDHDRGPSGQCFNLGSLCAEERSCDHNYRQHRILQIVSLELSHTRITLNREARSLRPGLFPLGQPDCLFGPTAVSLSATFHFGQFSLTFRDGIARPVTRPRPDRCGRNWF